MAFFNLVAVFFSRSDPVIDMDVPEYTRMRICLFSFNLYDQVSERHAHFFEHLNNVNARAAGQPAQEQSLGTESRLRINSYAGFSLHGFKRMSGFPGGGCFHDFNYTN